MLGMFEIDDLVVEACFVIPRPFLRLLILFHGRAIACHQIISVETTQLRLQYSGIVPKVFRTGFVALFCRRLPRVPMCCILEHFEG